MAPRAELVLGVDNRGFLAGLRGTGRQFQTWAQRTSKAVSASLKNAFGGLSGIAGLGGSIGLVQITRDTIEFDRRLVALGVSANKSRGQMAQLGVQLGDLAARTGVNRDQILAGAEAFTAATGDLDSYVASLDTLTKVQVATGASMDEVAKIAADFSMKLKIRPDEMMGVFDVLSVQAKMGAVELRDLAGELVGVTVGFSKFGEKGADAAASLGAWMQTLKKGAPSAAEATTQLQNLMGAVSGQGAAKLEKLGINVFTNRKTGEMRSLTAIMDDFIAKVPAADTSKIFNDKQVRDAINSFRMFRGEFDALRRPANTNGTIMRDYATNSETAAQKIARLQEQLKATFTNALARNLDSIVALVEKLVKALEWVAKNPEATLAIAAMFKGGGFLGGVGEAMAGMGGGGAGAGAGAGAAGGGRYGGFASAAGGVLRGGAIGLAVAKTLGSDLGAMGQGVITATHAMAGLPGPLGALGMAASGATDIMLGILKVAEAKIEADRKAFTESKWSGGGTARLAGLGFAQELTGADMMNLDKRAAFERGKQEDQARLRRWRAGEVTAGEQEEMKGLLLSAKAGGFLRTDEATGIPRLDMEAATKSIRGDTSMSKYQKDMLLETLPLALNTAFGDESMAMAIGDERVSAKRAWIAGGGVGAGEGAGWRSALGESPAPAMPQEMVVRVEAANQFTAWLENLPFYRNPGR